MMNVAGTQTAQLPRIANIGVLPASYLKAGPSVRRKRMWRATLSEVGMRWGLTIVSIALLGSGCTSMPCGCGGAPEKGAKTLLAWEVGPKKPDDEGQQADEKSEGQGKDAKNGEAAKQDSKNEGASKRSESSGSKQSGHAKNGSEEPEEPKELTADRPDFTEASTTVGLGRVQLESGYTYSRNKDLGISSAHSYPEALLRIGMLAEWFELRLGQNYSNSRGTNPDNTPFNTSGLEDLYVGTKLALTEQKGYLPEMAMILFATLPTGRGELSARRVLPGMSYDYSWDVIKNHLSLSAASVMATAVDDSGHGYLELAQSASVGYTLTEKLGAFTEFYGIFPHGARAADVAPQYYFDGGFSYKLTPDFQLDIRGGLGLNRHADDYFLGSGFVVRY